MEVLKELIDKILKNDINAVKDILSQNELKPDLCDEHGTTPLEHAAYKGNKEIVQLLLDQGADVNPGKHEYGYTALHFAAVSGNPDVCLLLLEHGAKPYATNSVGKTPSQMAAFVGNHACVTVINNFVPKSDVEYYTILTGFETEPKLPPLASSPLHKLIMQVNLHPAKVAITLSKSPILLENIDKVKNVLELMSQREMRRGPETNEIMSFKFHYYSSILEEIIKCKKALEQKDNDAKNENNNKKLLSGIELFIKTMLKINKGTTPEFQENFLKIVVRKFPNKECTIFHQMICSLARDDSPGALSIITSVINGQRGFADSDIAVCATCGEEKVNKKCSRCKSVQYCDRECQKYHWFIHKKDCCTSESISVTIVNKEINEKLKQEAVSLTTETLVKEVQSLKDS